MLTINDITEWCKFKSVSWLSITIDLKTDQWIYTSAWNDWLSWRNRIFRTMDDIQTLIKSWWLKYIDMHKTVSVSKIKKDFPEYIDRDIERFETKKDKKVFGTNTIIIGDKVYDKTNPVLYRIIKDIKYDADNNIIWYILSSFNPTNPTDVEDCRELSLEQVKEILSEDNSLPPITKAEIAKRYNLTNESLLCITK